MAMKTGFGIFRRYQGPPFSFVSSLANRLFSDSNTLGGSRRAAFFCSFFGDLAFVEVEVLTAVATGTGINDAPHELGPRYLGVSAAGGAAAGEAAAGCDAPESSLTADSSIRSEGSGAISLSIWLNDGSSSSASRRVSPDSNSPGLGAASERAARNSSSSTGDLE